MRVIATFGALLVPWALGSCAGHRIAPLLADDLWKLQVCRSEGYTSMQPCAYIDRRLILRVENPAGRPGQHGPVVFEQHISQELAQQIYMSAIAAIRSFNSSTPPGQVVFDGTLFNIELTANENTAKVAFGGASVLNMNREVRELNRLLHETTHAF